MTQPQEKQETSQQEQKTYEKTLELNDFSDDAKNIVKDYICILCEGVFFNPVIDTCGHLFCEKCFSIFDPTFSICPQSHLALSTKPTKVNIILNIIEKQVMYCNNKSKGCPWEGLVKDYHEHLNTTCPKQLVKCIMEGCLAEIPREEFNGHIAGCEYRTIQCLHCNKNFPYKDLEEHLIICPKVPLDCPQDCNQKIQREMIEEHIKTQCDNTKISCTFQAIGCNEMVFKRELKQHKKEEYNTHLDLVFQSIFNNNLKTQERFNSIEEKLMQLTDLKRQGTFQISAVAREKVSLNIIQNTPEMMIIGKKRQRPVPIDDAPITNIDFEATRKFLEEQEKKQEEMNILTEPYKDKNGPSIFDYIHAAQGVSFYGNKAKCISSKIEHKFVYFNENVDLTKGNTHWQIKILSPCIWIGLGLCDREKVLENDSKFYTKSSMFDHGTFLISTNGYLWNCNKTQENSVTLSNFPPVNTGDIFDFIYDPIACELKFKHSYYEGKLTDVCGKDLMCCIVFLHYNNEVEVILDS